MDPIFSKEAKPVKWPWASVTPTEGLNDPAVFLGVLRAMAKCEGQAPGSPEFLAELERVMIETGTSVDLVRNSERNLLRNSRQYWLSKGLIEDESGVIRLTQFGHLWANADCTNEEFAFQAIRKFSIQTVAGTVYPLKLLLLVIRAIPVKDGSWLTADEVLRIVAPLGSLAPEMIAKSVLGYRKRPEDYPPLFEVRSNDKRIAREPLLFLANFGILREEGGKFYCIDYVQNLEDVFADTGGDARSALANAVRLERTKSVVYRPDQAKFRKAVFAASRGACLITGETVSVVLEAAHIKPFASNGPDVAENGFCLRSDVHQLYDANLLRICEDGGLKLLDEAMASPHYSQIQTRRIVIPDYINRDFMKWRSRYT